MKSKRRQRTELGYVRNAYQRLRKLGVPSQWEAAILGRSVDLLLFNEEALVTIEFKLRDWRRAIRQALDHQVAADFAYICVPCEPTPKLLEAARKDGIGVMRFQEAGDWPFTVVEPASRSTRTWSVLRNELCRKLLTKSRTTHGSPC